MKRVKCIGTPPLTEYKENKVYEAYYNYNGDILEVNVIYGDGTDSAFDMMQFYRYFQII